MDYADWLGGVSKLASTAGRLRIKVLYLVMDGPSAAPRPLLIVNVVNNKRRNTVITLLNIPRSRSAPKLENVQAFR